MSSYYKIIYSEWFIAKGFKPKLVKNLLFILNLEAMEGCKFKRSLASFEEQPNSVSTDEIAKKM